MDYNEIEINGKANHQDNQKKKIPIVSPMPEMEYILSRYHEETLEYMKSKSLLNHLEE